VIDLFFLKEQVMPEVKIAEKFCKGCGLCVWVCPKGVLEMSGKTNAAGITPAVPRPDAECTACLNCAIICPDAAVEVFK
jgi:2-oxoglutarate ferredoxin oxidoreductase subunit delta